MPRSGGGMETKMDIKKICSHVDHTILKADTSLKDIDKLCEEAIRLKTASVCIPPHYIKYVHDKYGKELVICTVVGFPLGYACSEAKKAETKKALEDGALEIDMVINICDVKNKDYDKVEAEIRQLKELVGDKVLKVIIECCYLDEEEKIKLCEIVSKAKADFIKTSTGFGSSGAKKEDIELFKKHISKDVKIKAAGGIRTLEDMEEFINLGCERIGSSSIGKLC